MPRSSREPTTTDFERIDQLAQKFQWSTMRMERHARAMASRIRDIDKMYRRGAAAQQRGYDRVARIFEVAAREMESNPPPPPQTIENSISAEESLVRGVCHTSEAVIALTNRYGEEVSFADPQIDESRCTFPFEIRGATITEVRQLVRSHS